MSAIATEGNQALYIGDRRSFRIDAGQPREGGDGSEFIPFEEGTIEEAVATFLAFGGEHVFLQDANSLAMWPEQLVEVLEPVLDRYQHYLR